MLRKIQSLFERVVFLIEEHPTPVRRYFGLFFALLAVRLCLEFFSSHRLFTLADVMHIGLWFVFIVMAFLIQLHLFSGVPIAKATKLVVVGFSIALTAPIIDLILTGGIGAKMNYLSIHSWQDAVFSYFTVGGASLSRGATLGIRIEIVLLVIASFNYVRTKRKSIGWGLLAGWSIYTVLFLSGTVPFILGFIVDTWQLTYQPNDQSTLLLLLSLDLGLLGIALVRHSPKKAWQLLRNTAWGSLLIGFFMFLFGAGLSYHAYPDNWNLDPTTLFWFPLLACLFVLLALFSGWQRMNIREKKNPDATNRVRNFLLLAALLVGLAMGESLVFGIGVILGLQILLYEPPLNLHRAPLLRNLMGSMLLCGAALLGFVAFGGPMVGFPHSTLLVLVIAQCLGSWFRDSLRPKAGELPFWVAFWEKRQSLFRWIAGISLALAGTVTAFLLLPVGSWQWMAMALSIIAGGIALRFPDKISWIFFVLGIYYACLAISAWL